MIKVSASSGQPPVRPADIRSVCRSASRSTGRRRELKERKQKRTRIWLSVALSVTGDALLAIPLLQPQYPLIREQVLIMCSLLNRKFSTKLTLRRHMGIHRGEKPFSCPHCPYSSRLKSSLLQHLRTHTGSMHTEEFHCQVRHTPLGQCLHGADAVSRDCVQVSGRTGAPSARTRRSIAALCSDTAGLTVRRSRTGVNTVTIAGNMHARSYTCHSEKTTS